MPEPNLDFSFYAGGIEDGILEILEAPMRAIGVKSFGTYSGELDDEKKLQEAISTQVLKAPWLLVAYAGGESFNDAPTAKVAGKSRKHIHHCTFSLVVADDNPQGEKARRRNKVYPMISVVWDKLIGVRLIKQVEEVQYQLNVDPFDEPDVLRIKVPNVTAFAVVFDTEFRWSSPVPTTTEVAVEDVIVGVNSLNDAGGPLAIGAPGVHTEVTS
jgi:hypothetical protein